MNKGRSTVNWIPDKHYQNRSVALEYDKVRFTSVSGRVFNFLERRAIAKCFSKLPPNASIVDIPCGTGRLAGPLLRHGYAIHGMDISAEMLDVAKHRLEFAGTRFSTEVANAKQLPKDHPTYDAALCARVLMHFPLPEQIAFLAGVAKLSRGRVVINHCLDSPYQRLRRGLKKTLGHRPSARFPVTNRDIKALLQGAGLRETRRYRLCSPISEAVYIVAEKT